MVPEVSLAAQVLAEPLIETISQFKDLVQEEGKEVEEEEVTPWP